MQTPNEHISLLTDLLPQYRSVNTLYQEIAEKFVLSFDAQCAITEFYNEFNHIQTFEKSILNFLLSTDKGKQGQIIPNLRAEIAKNTEIYTTNKEFFCGIDIIKVCSGRRNSLKIEIDGQLKDTNKLWQELAVIKGNLESSSWKNDKIGIERLTREEDRLDNLYKQEKQKLETLYQKQKESDNHASKYLENVFSNIYELGCSLISLLDNYFPVEKENIPTLGSAIVEESTISESETQTEIEPNMIFRTGKYEKFTTLESKLTNDKYLSPELHWISTHENGKPDIKRLVTFLVALMDNKYFLPGKDPKIKAFFESRYHISIGQNFERKRREPLLDEYKAVFYDYPF